MTEHFSMDHLTFQRSVLDMIDSLLNENVDSFVSQFMPNAEMILPNAHVTGTDSIAKAVQGLYRSYEDISIELERVLIQDNLGVVQWHWCDRNRSTGERHETDSAIFLVFEGPKILQWREYHAPALTPKS